MLLTRINYKIMKTMNYLFTAAFVFLMVACSAENPTAENDLQSTEFKGKTEEIKFYFELDLHQLALKHKLRELMLELVQIEEEIESSEGYVSEDLQERLERVQRMIDERRFEYERNNETIDNLRPKGPGRPSNPCGGDDIERCPLELENAKIYSFGREEITATLTNNDQECGELVDLVEVPEYEGPVYEVVLEFEEGCADEIKISGVNTDGNKFAYSFPVAR